MSKVQVAVIDYGLSNTFSIKKALESLGAQVNITHKKEKILGAQAVVLPGVGAFEVGMKNICEFGLVDCLKEFVTSGRPILGICLGMQLFLSRSEEGGIYKGLDFIKGTVTRLKENPQNLKIPHIGWNMIKFLKPGSSNDDRWSCVIVEGIPDASFVYFVHSYVPVLNEPKYVTALTEYGENQFCSILKKGNIMGCQFHPELSGAIGLKILKNFLSYIH